MQAVDVDVNRGALVGGQAAARELRSLVRPCDIDPLGRFVVGFERIVIERAGSAKPEVIVVRAERDEFAAELLGSLPLMIATTFRAGAGTTLDLTSPCSVRPSVPGLAFASGTPRTFATAAGSRASVRRDGALSSGDCMRVRPLNPKARSRGISDGWSTVMNATAPG